MADTVSHTFDITSFTSRLALCRTEDELASVIAHEMGHVLARHTGEKLTHEISGNAFAALFGYLTSALFGWDPGSSTDAMNRGRQLTLEIPHSREMEREADLIGLKLMGGACFDVSVAGNTFRRMEAEEGESSSVKKYLSTHPGHGERVQNMRRWAEDVVRENKGREGECAEIRQRWEKARRGNTI